MEKKMIAAEKNIIEQIAADHGAVSKRDLEMKMYTWMGVGGKADHMIFPKTISSVERIIHDLTAYSLPFRILGAGSNLIVSDEGVADVIVATVELERTIEVDNNIVRASSGIPLSRLIRKLAESGLGGAEFAEGIPGTIGGAVIMNAGSYGHTISEFIREVSYIDEKGKQTSRKCSSEDFGYRRSPFSSRQFLTGIAFEFVTKDREKILAEIEEVKEKRKKSQPWDVKSSGCIFKNPEGNHAGRIIEAAGLKGLKKGDAMVSDIHANFIVNTGEARAADIFWLIDRVKEEVLKKTGILLEEEVVVWKR